MPPVNQNFMAMSNYGSQYQPMPPLALTQPASMADWRSPYVPQTRSFAVGAPAQPNLGTTSYDSFGSPVAVGSPAALNADPSGLAMAQMNLNTTMPATNLGGGQRGIMDSFLQQRNTDGTTSGGYGQAALGVLQGVGGLYLGMQQYNLAKDSLAFQKDSFNRQFDVNKNLTNSRLEDRQRARVAANSGAYQSVGDYMNQNGVK